MHVAAGRGFGSVDIGVRVNPDEADLLVLAAVELRDAGHRAGSDGVIASQHHGHFAGFQRLQHQLGVLGAGRGDFFQILWRGDRLLFLLGERDRHVAGILHHVAEFFQPGLQTRHPHRRGSHIHAAARLAEVERHTDHTDFSGSDAGISSRDCAIIRLADSHSRFSAGDQLGIQPMQHPGERDRLPHMLQTANPGHGSLDAHAKAAVGHAAVFAQIQIPLEGFFGQAMFTNALQ